MACSYQYIGETHVDKLNLITSNVYNYINNYDQE